MSDNYPVTQGGAVGINVVLRDSLGNIIQTYSGSEPLTTTVWAGGSQTAAFTATTAWTTAASGELSISITDAQTAALAPGRYRGLTRIGASGSQVDGYEFTLDVTPFAGTDTAPPAYTTYADLLRYGRSWLRQLQTDDDTSGFMDFQGRARSWIENILQKHYRTGVYPLGGYTYGGSGGGPYISGMRSQYLQDFLDADGLVLTDEIKQLCAFKALGLICEAQIDGDPTNRYAGMARFYNSQADYMATCLVAEIDSDGDGIGDFPIDCTTCYPQQG